jgi:hypothetical protein
MSTRSIIAIQNEKTGLISSVYCHFDGYIEHNGKILFENYTTPEHVRELISLGDMSSLSHTIESCEFYCRDRGESLIVRFNDTLEDFYNYSQCFDYSYIFRKVDNEWKWFVISSPSNGKSKPVMQELVICDIDDGDE